MRGRALALVFLLLAGCGGTLAPRSEGDEVIELLDRFHRLAGLAADEQRRELAAAQAEFEREAGEGQRLRLALALSLPRLAGQDEARVVALLAPIDGPAGEQSSPRRDLAHLLARLAGERQRLAREEQRRYDGALREEQRRSHELQQKLDALRAIDRDMRQRAPSGRRP